MKIRPVVAEFFLADGEMEGRIDSPDEANSRFSPILRKRLTAVSSISARTSHRTVLITKSNHGERLGRCSSHMLSNFNQNRNMSVGSRSVVDRRT